MKTNNKHLKLKTVTNEDVDHIHQIIIEGLLGIKEEVHKKLGVTHYPVERFFSHNLDCINALLFGRLEELQ